MATSYIDLIVKKRDAKALTGPEIDRLVRGISSGLVPDHQIGALLMAIYLKGLTRVETADLTRAMVESGGIVDLSSIEGFKADKHSTGGVGDKVTLVLGPLIAAAGVKFSKLSGRGLGHTGGTLDKLESIPGMRVDLSIEEFIEQVRAIGLSVTGQTKQLVPADAVIYGLRDQTGTVDSIPLIASSIMCKKLAAGADGILLDVKCGRGAFMKSIEDARELADQMVAIGTSADKETRALVTSMDVPLGFAVGNALEVREAIETLRGQGPKDLEDEVLAVGAEILLMAADAERATTGTLRDGSREMAEESLQSLLRDGTAVGKFREMVQAQGGDSRVLDDPQRLPCAETVEVVQSPVSGYVQGIDALAIGEIVMDLGASRRAKGDSVSPSAGVVVRAKPGHNLGEVEVGTPLLELHVPSDRSLPVSLDEIKRRALAAFSIGQEPAPPTPTVLARITPTN